MNQIGKMKLISARYRGIDRLKVCRLVHRPEEIGSLKHFRQLQQQQVGIILKAKRAGAVSEMNVSLAIVGCQTSEKKKQAHVQ